jgi:hypothetical protein
MHWLMEGIGDIGWLGMRWLGSDRGYLVEQRRLKWVCRENNMQHRRPRAHKRRVLGDGSKQQHQCGAACAEGRSAAAGRHGRHGWHGIAKQEGGCVDGGGSGKRAHAGRHHRRPAHWGCTLGRAREAIHPYGPAAAD